eukprot:13540979-Alexandrium_andersonii.AAC.1
MSFVASPPATSTNMTSPAKAAPAEPSTSPWGWQRADSERTNSLLGRQGVRGRGEGIQRGHCGQRPEW